MGAKDIERQQPNVKAMKKNGAEVIPVYSGSQTLVDAVSECMRFWVANCDTTAMCVGSTVGPAVFVRICGWSTSQISRELKVQLINEFGSIPKKLKLYNCVGGGSSSFGFWNEFMDLDKKQCEFIGVEAGGPAKSKKHAAPLTYGSKIGILHGAAQYVNQNSDGQIEETESISAGLDYPGISPLHCFLKDVGRARYTAASDEEALNAYKLVTKYEKLRPSLEPSHAFSVAIKESKKLSKDTIVIVNSCGDAYKDKGILEKKLGKNMLNPISTAFIKAKKEKRPALLTYTVAGDSSKKQSLDILKSISKNVDILEVGVPHNTPVADGSQIQTSAYRAIKKGIKINDIFKIIRDFKKYDKSKPVILMGYYNMIYQYGENYFLDKCKISGVNGLIVVDLPWPENKNFAKKCKKKNIYFIQLLSPTTTRTRLKKIIQDSHPMNYFISMLSTTGGKLKVSPKKILQNYNKIKKINPKKNTVIGFGITEKTISKLKSADGLVVGSAICKEITRSLRSRQNAVTNVSKLVEKLKNKIK